MQMRRRIDQLTARLARIAPEGSARWSEIEQLDPLDILGQAKEFDMNFGLAVSIGPMESRTIGSASRSDREFTAPEIAAFAALINDLHDKTEPPTSLTPAQAEALKCVAEGDRYAAAANKLGISESAFKARLASARTMPIFFARDVRRSSFIIAGISRKPWAWNTINTIHRNRGG